MKLSPLIVALLALCLCLASQARGQTPDVPLFSLERTQLYLGASYDWYAAEDENNVPPFDKEFALGVHGSHNIVPELDAVGSLKYGVDNRLTFGAAGLGYTFYHQPLWDLSARMSYEWIWGEQIPASFEKQFTAGLYGQRQLLPKLDLAAGGKYGLDNRDVNVMVGLRYPFFVGNQR